MLYKILFLGISIWSSLANAQPYASSSAQLIDYNFGPTLDARDKALNVFPNPMNDILTIWTREIHPDTLHQVRVLGISGELVLHTTLLNRETNLNLSHLPEGWYILHIRKGKEEITQRIMKTSGP